MSDSSLRRFELGVLILRVGFGLGFLWFHGWPKISGGPELWQGLGGAVGSLGIELEAGAMWFGLAAAVAESIGALFIVLGLFFRPTSFILAFVMLVATANHFVTGQGTPAHSFKNIWVFLGLGVMGPGRYSVDAWWAARRARR